MPDCTIGELLGGHCELCDSIKCGNMLSIEYEKEAKIVEVKASFDELLSIDEVIQFEERLAQAINVSKVRLFPKYKPNMLTQECMPDIVSELARSGASDRKSVV